MRCTAVLCLVFGTLDAAEVDLRAVLKSVEGRYNSAKTLQVAFRETFATQGRPRQTESGRLTLRKPGRMRWDYSTPAGKLFLSDGKIAYLYTPQGNRVEQMPLKESDDMRTPLAFLLGKLDFRKEFRDFTLKQEREGLRVTATAKSDKSPYGNIEMLISPAFEIRTLVVNGQDGSVLTFQFEGEQMNPEVDDSRFRFQMPAGATFVNAEAVR